MQSVLSESYTSVKRIAALWFENHSPTPNLRAFELLFMRIAVRPDPSVDPKGGAVLTTILPRILSWSGQCGPGLQHNTSRSAARGGGTTRTAADPVLSGAGAFPGDRFSALGNIFGTEDSTVQTSSLTEDRCIHGPVVLHSNRKDGAHPYG